jgi:hypothetical protein
MKSSSSYLRPMDLRDILDETFDLYKDNFALFFSITAVVFLPFQLLIGALGGSAFDFSHPDSTAAMGAVLTRSAMLFPWLFVYYLTIGALTAAISARCLGETSSLRDAYRSIYERFFPFLLTLFQSMLIMGLGIFVLVMAVGAVVAALLTMENVVAFILMAVIIFVAIVAGLVYCFLFAFIVPVFVLEGKTGGAAIKRSRELILFNLRKVMGAISMTAIITTLITSILAIPVAVILGMFESGRQASQLSGLLGGAVNGFVQALAQPIQLIVVVLLYYDVRIRREGFDLEMMANELRGGAPPSDPVFPPMDDATAAFSPNGREAATPSSEPSAGIEPSEGTHAGEGITASLADDDTGDDSPNPEPRG